MNDLKKKVLSGVFWQGLCNIGSKGLNFLFSIILARLLMPKEFGSVAILMIFIGIAEVFIDSGFSTALIQKKDADEIDCSCVFYINLMVSVFCYIRLFFSAPAIAGFYRDPNLTIYFRVLAVGVVIRSLSLIQGALLNKRMLFHLSFRIGFCSLLLSGATGIVMAYNGFGGWSLIAQQLVNSVVSTLLLWFFVRWRPALVFVWARVKTLFRFGSKILATSLLDALCNNLFGILVGRLFSLQMLAYYNRGRHIPETGMGIINSTIGSVVLPAFSQIQNDPPRVKHLMRNSLQVTMFLVCPAMALLAVLAKPLVLVLLTEKWLPSVIFIQVSCLIFLVWPLHTLNLQVIIARGRSDYMLILEVIKKIQIVLVLLLTYPFGVEAMVWGMAVNGLVCAFENAWPNRKLINYSFWGQVRDFTPYLLWAVIAALPVAVILHWLHIQAGLQLTIGFILYGVIYSGGLAMTGMLPSGIAAVREKIPVFHFGK